MSRTRDLSSFVSRHVLVDLCERRALRRARELLVATNDAVRACNAVLSVLSRIAAWQEAVRILLDVAGDAVGYTCTMTACSRSGFWTKSLMLLERMEQQRVERDGVAMNAACGACERATLWQAAVRLMHWEKRAVSSTIYACMKGNHWPSATWLLQNAAAEGLMLDGAALTPLLDCQWLRSEILLQWMRRSNIETDHVSQEVFSHAAGQAHQWQRALWPQFRSRTVAAALSTLNVIIIMIIQLKNLYLWRENGRCCGGALTSWCFAVASLVTLTAWSMADAINCCMTLAICTKVNWSLSIELLRAASPSHIDTATATAAISTCTAAGIWSLMRQRRLLPSTATAEHGLLPSLAVQNAEMSVVTSSTWTRSLQRLRADGITWTAAAVACGVNGWAEAQQLLREMKDLQVEVSYITATTIAGASLFWEDALVLQQRWNAAANGALGVLARNGCWSRAMHMAYRECLPMDLKNRQIGFNSVVAACSSAGQWQQAQYVFQQHSCDTVGLSAALGPWKAALALLRGSMSVDAVCFGVTIAACARACEERQGRFSSTSNACTFFSFNGFLLLLYPVHWGKNMVHTGLLQVPHPTPALPLAQLLHNLNGSNVRWQLCSFVTSLGQPSQMAPLETCARRRNSQLMPGEVFL
eukprot:symbB.v1.2.018751.t1/scaffold1508.1/size114708/10